MVLGVWQITIEINLLVLMVLTSKKLILVSLRFHLRAFVVYYINNDFHYAIKYSKVHHFADNTNLTYFNTVFPQIRAGTKISVTL